MPKSALVTIEDNQTTHVKGSHKSIYKSIPADVLKNLPIHLQNYKLALWDKDKQNLILVMDINIDGKQTRAAVGINYKLNRGKTTNSVRSLGVVQPDALQDIKTYEIIEGSWE